MQEHKTCDGMIRRDLLKVGALSLGGLTLPHYPHWPAMEKLPQDGQIAHIH